ncbi:MAG: AEC family transporter [Pseudomonadota bacterium]
MGTVIDIILPVFGVVIIGFVAAKFRWFDQSAARGLSLFVFNFAVPLLLFQSLASTPLPSDIEWGFLISYYAGAFLVFGLSMLVSGQGFGRRLDEQGIFGLSAAFSNTVMLGIPLVLTTFGDEAALPLFLIIALHALVMFPTVTLIIEGGRGRGVGFFKVILVTAKGLAQNPIIWGLLAGLLFNQMRWSLPSALDDIAALLARAALPCGLFAMGASLAWFKVAGHVNQALMTVSLKLIIHPLAVWFLATIVFDLDPMWAGVAILLASAPTGINVYLFAQRYGICIGSSATTVLVGSLFSIFTIAGVLLILPGQ